MKDWSKYNNYYDNNSHLEAWCKIVDTLGEVAPGWLNEGLPNETALEKAVAAIRKLAANQNTVEIKDGVRYLNGQRITIDEDGSP